MSAGKQNITITLKEYMEYQELIKHKKEVKITTETHYIDRPEINSFGITWSSDGKVWVSLCGKLERAGIKISELIRINDELMRINDELMDRNIFQRISNKVIK